jgi:hypothetical protein
MHGIIFQGETHREGNMGFSFFGMPYHWWRTDSVWELHSKYTEKFCFGLRVHMIRWMLTSNFNFFFFFNFFILAILYRVTPMEEAIPDISTCLDVESRGALTLGMPCSKGIRVIHKVTLSSPLSLGLLSPPIPSFQWYPQSNEILFVKSQYEMLKLSV